MRQELERQAHAELAAARQRPREHETGDVGARDEQHETATTIAKSGVSKRVRSDELPVAAATRVNGWSW